MNKLRVAVRCYLMQIGVAVVGIGRGLSAAKEQQIETRFVPFELDLVGVEKALVGNHIGEVRVLKQANGGRLSLLADRMHGYTF